MAPTLTSRDTEILSCVFQCFKDPEAVKVDYSKLADLAGFKNAASASAIWGTLKKKLLSGATGEAVTPKTTKATGGKANAGANGDDEATPSKSTAKKPRARKPKAVANTEEEAATSPIPDDDAAEIKTEENDVLAAASTSPTLEAASSPVAKVTPKKRTPKAKATFDAAAAAGEGTLSKKRVRKVKDENAEPKTATKRAKKAPATEEEPTKEEEDSTKEDESEDGPVKTENGYENGYESLFGSQAVQNAIDDGLTAEEHHAQQVADDDILFNSFTNVNEDSVGAV